MSVAVSDFFDVTVVGEVTIIKLVGAADYRRDLLRGLDLSPLIHRIDGRLPPAELAVWEQFRNDLCAFLDTNKPAKVVLDFAGLHRIGNQPVISTAMNSVYATAKRLSDAIGCQWRICGLTEVSSSVWGISSLHLIFPQVHKTQLDAIKAFSASVTDST